MFRYDVLSNVNITYDFMQLLFNNALKYDMQQELVD